MKKILSLLLVLVLSFSLFGCVAEQPEVTDRTPSQVTTPEPTETEPPQTEPTEPPVDPSVLTAKLPEGASVFDLDLGGMTLEQATEALNTLIAGYRLKLTVNDTVFNFTASELAMELSTESFARWFAGSVEGEPTEGTGLILFSMSRSLSAIKGKFGQTAKDASITYRQDLARFVTVPHTDGTVVDTAQAEVAIRKAVQTLSPTASATVKMTDTTATIQADDPRVLSAMEEANSYLTIALSYTFYPPELSPAREDLDIHTIASMLKVESDYSVVVDESAVQKYVKKMASRHGGTREAPFVTTYGTSISYTAEYYKAVLDQPAMCQDLSYCLKNKLSGTRSTSYYTANNASKPYGGDYVEINLSDQRLWVYRDGEMKCESPLVSGNVSTRHWTDPGVFTIYEKDKNATLAGDDYVSYVDYWMAFDGPVGLHDATWRSEFGGDIYKYNGSHGCVNLPHASAKKIYDLVYVGMKVIVYGGAKTVSSLTQEITGTSAYTVHEDSAPFALDIQVKYTDKEMTYTSSDLNVVQVDHQGVVTVVGAGTATITVKSITYNNKTFTVTITVTGEPEPSEPTETDPTEPTETEPTEPTETEPSDSTETEPSEPTETEPTEPADTEPSEPTETEPTEPVPEPASSEATA